jgi:hypothetical protein
MWHTWGRRNLPALLRVGRLEGKCPPGRPWLRCEGNIKIYLKGTGSWMWTGCIWTRVGTNNRLSWTCSVREMRVIYWIFEDLFASQEGLCIFQLVTAKSEYTLLFYIGCIYFLPFTFFLFLVWFYCRWSACMRIWL